VLEPNIFAPLGMGGQLEYTL